MELSELLGYLFLAAPFVVVVLLAAGLLAFLFGLYRNPLIAVASVLGVTVWEAAVIEVEGIHLGLRITPFDVVLACIFFIGILRVLSVPGVGPNLPRPLVVLLCLLFLSFAIGLLRFGTPAGVEFRNEFYIWSGCFYMLTFRAERLWLDRVLTLWLTAAFMLCVVVWYRWTADAFGLEWFEPLWRYADVTAVEFNRVAPSQVAYLLGIAAMISMASIAAGQGNAMHFVFLPALVLTIVFLQHRSVWVSALIPLLLLLVLLRRTEKLSLHGPLLAAIATVVVVGAVLSSGLFGGAVESVVNQANRATSTTGGTFVSRVEGWRALLPQWVNSGPFAMAIGQPFGAGFERHQGSTWGEKAITYSPHNYYVLLLLRIGAIGMLAYVALLWKLWRVGFTQVDAKVRFGPPLIAALTLSLALHSIPYYPTAASGLLFGAALCYSIRRREDSLPGREAAAKPAAAVNPNRRSAVDSSAKVNRGSPA